jgi:hypothetical protein
MRTVLTTAHPEDPQCCFGGVVLRELVVVVPFLVVVVPFFELPPQAAVQSATAAIAPSAARPRNLENIRTSPLFHRIRSRRIRHA